MDTHNRVPVLCTEAGMTVLIISGSLQQRLSIKVSVSEKSYSVGYQVRMKTSY